MNIPAHSARAAAVADALPMPRQTLHHHVVAHLRRLVVEGDVAPGAKLNERELCERLQVSRTPLREAIKMLAAEGLVELVAHRGAVAAALSEQDVANTFEVIAGLEGQSGELAAERISDAERNEIQALHFEMLAAHARRDLPAYYAMNAQIHDRINAAARNPVLTQTYRTINARLQALRFRSNFDEAKWNRAVAEHKQMIKLLAARDGAALRAVLVAHLEHKRDAVLDLMRNGRIGAAPKAGA
jgi:DNA-binding GntR family transcriptional regulator